MKSYETFVNNGLNIDKFENYHNKSENLPKNEHEVIFMQMILIGDCSIISMTDTNEYKVYYVHHALTR